MILVEDFFSFMVFVSTKQINCCACLLGVCFEDQDTTVTHVVWSLQECVAFQTQMASGPPGAGTSQSLFRVAHSGWYPWSQPIRSTKQHEQEIFCPRTKYRCDFFCVTSGLIP